MIFQERDKKILRWINGFGFATAEQIQRFMGVKTTTAYVRIKKLVDHGYLKRERILHGESRIHRVTKKGVQASGDHILPLKKINLGTYLHDRSLVDLALKLEESEHGKFQPERQIRHDEGLSGLGNTGHIADGYLFLQNQKPIAIELELSVKSRARLNNIIREYGGNLSVSEVWYFTDQNQVFNAIQKASNDYPFIKISMWNRNEQ